MIDSSFRGRCSFQLRACLICREIQLFGPEFSSRPVSCRHSASRRSARITTHVTPDMTSPSTGPSRPNVGYNDPPEDIFGDVNGLDGKAKGKTKGYFLAQDAGDDDEDHNRGLLEEDGDNDRKPRKQPRSRRLNNSSISSSNHYRENSRGSSTMDTLEIMNGGPSTSKPSRGNRYPAHSSIPTQPLGSGSAEGRPSNHIRHLSESLGKEIYALEHEFEDTLFRGTETDRRNHDIAPGRDGQAKHHLDNQSMEMDVAVDEETLRAMRRSRYIRSAAVTGIFVLLWWVPLLYFSHIIR